MRTAILLLVFCVTHLGAQAAAPTPGPVYLVNLSQNALQVRLNGSAAVAAPALTALPAMQMTTVRLGTRSSAGAPAAGLLATGSNTLLITSGDIEFVATLKLGNIGPLSSPSGLAATCVVYLTFFNNPGMATVTCRLGSGGETTITSGPIYPKD